MHKYAVLLRGVNVGKAQLKMADLKRMAEELGYGQVRTLLNSGNLVLQTKQSANQVKQALEKALTAHMSNPMYCIVRNLAEIEALIEAAGDEIAGYNQYILFCERPLYSELSQAYAEYGHQPPEGLKNLGQEMLWVVRERETLQGFGSKVLGSARYRDQLTSRNLRTVRKLADAMRATK